MSQKQDIGKIDLFHNDKLSQPEKAYSSVYFFLLMAAFLVLEVLVASVVALVSLVLLPFYFLSF